MRFEEWEPVYEAILADFGYPRGADEHARDLLGSLAGPFDLDRLAAVSEATVAVAGGAPTLEDELETITGADLVIAASTAADVLRDHGMEVHCLVTDLDKRPETARVLSEEGVPVVVHAHGDNRALIEKYVPTFVGEQILPTTQAAPSGPVQNFGGFTDGDRAAFLADHLGAERLRFPGWDFDDPTVGPEKRRKLQWAERLVAWLETRRGDSFRLLDGRRDHIESPL